MLNCDIFQSGFLSEPFSIERGYCQGDPLAPYLLCAQILYLMMDLKKLKGINIDN